MTTLGAALVGFGAEASIQRESGTLALATAGGLWLGFSIVLSLFCGSYFCMRVARFVTAKVGAAHAFVIASMFFILLAASTGGFIGGLVGGLGQVLGTAGSQASQLTKAPIVQDTFNRALGHDTLRSSPSEVISGLATRLLTNDADSAKSYLEFETGLPESEIEARIQTLQADFKAAAKSIGQKSAQTLVDTGWTLFVTIFVGLIAAVIGGRIGAHANAERPIASVARREPIVATQQPARA
jgi:hypothetical protein